MNLQELTTLAAAGESEGMEFKRSTGQRTEAAQAVCAMLNDLGGFVLFGVTDRGSIIGQPISTRTLEEVATKCAVSIPRSFPTSRRSAWPAARPSSPCGCPGAARPTSTTAGRTSATGRPRS